MNLERFITAAKEAGTNIIAVTKEMVIDPIKIFFGEPPPSEQSKPKAAKTTPTIDTKLTSYAAITKMTREGEPQKQLKTSVENNVVAPKTSAATYDLFSSPNPKQQKDDNQNKVEKRGPETKKTGG